MSDITREEAIEVLKLNNPFMAGKDKETFSKAIDKGIEALEKQADIISRIEAEKNKLNEEGELHYSKSEIAIFDKCLGYLKG